MDKSGENILPLVIAGGFGKRLAPLSTIVDAFRQAMSEGSFGQSNINIEASGDMSSIVRLLNFKIKDENNRIGNAFVNDIHIQEVISISQFVRGANIVRIDNEDFGVGILKIERNCDVLDKIAKRTINGDLYREILGVYFNYTITFGTFWDMDQYDRLYKKLTSRQEFHIISIPTNKGFMTFKGYISKVKVIIDNN